MGLRPLVCFAKCRYTAVLDLLIYAGAGRKDKRVTTHSCPCIAVFRLPPEAIKRLSHYRFLRIDDVGFDEESKSGVFTLFAYPGKWSLPSLGEADVVQLKGLEYTAIAYQGSAEKLNDYNARYHILLDAQAQQITWNDGTGAAFVDRKGENMFFPRDLKGISGCSVWKTVDTSVPVEKWQTLSAKVVGVETGVYQDRQVIRVTRWIAVTTLIHEAFPELRPAINLLR